jgi:hypothetical protein
MSIKVSFKKSRMYIRLVVLIALLLALGIVAYMQVKANQEPQGTNIPTPNDFPLFENNTDIIYTPEPTEVISKIVDLAQGLPDEDKRVYIIQRADSSYEEYIVPVGNREAMYDLLRLGPHDKIVNAWPFKIIEPPPLLSPQAPVETPTQPGYPPPVSTSDISPTVITPDTYP